MLLSERLLLLLLLPLSGGVGQDPVPKDGDPGADAGQVGLCAPDAPADDAAEEPSAVFPLDDQRTARVSLKS